VIAAVATAGVAAITLVWEVVARRRAHARAARTAPALMPMRIVHRGRVHGRRGPAHPER